MKVVEVQNRMIVAENICYLENEEERIFIRMVEGSSFRLSFDSVQNASEYFSSFKRFLRSGSPGLFIISKYDGGLSDCELIEEGCKKEKEKK